VNDLFTGLDKFFSNSTSR